MKTSRSTQIYRVNVSLFSLLLLATCLILLSSCKEDDDPDTIKKDPILEFTVSKTTVEIGEVVDFTSTSENVSNLLWEFGDGNSSEKADPSHSFAMEGIYSVYLYASNENGETIFKTKDITVNKPLVIYDEKPEGYLTSDFTFDAIKISTNIIYGQDFSQNTVTLYEPDRTTFNKPLILLSPGGAWRSYSREAELTDMIEKLALRGYSVGLVRYSLVNPGEEPGPDIMVKTVIDQRNAIRFFRKNAHDFKIDPNNIFLGGWSNGAIISIPNAMVDDENLDLIANENLKVAVSNAMNKYEDHNLYTEFDYNVNGALAMFGWSFDIDMINSVKTPILFINHAQATMGDGTTLTWGEFEFNGSTLYGLDKVTEKAVEVGYSQPEEVKLIKMNGPLTLSEFPSVESLSLSNLAEIESFFLKHYIE